MVKIERDLKMQKTLDVKIKLSEESKKLGYPKYATSGSSGMDLYNAGASNTIKPKQIKLIKTGVFLEIPEGYEAQIRPRSGLSLKYGITVLNSPGTIDSDYRGEVGVILVNHSDQPFDIEEGMKIAQMVFCKYEKVEFFESEELSNSTRGEGGFGHTGI